MSSHTLQSIDNKTIFESLATPYIVFAADAPNFTVLAENIAHARIAMVNRGDIVGKPLLEAFPDMSEDYSTTGKSQFVESLQKVIKTGKPNSMSNFKYDLRDAAGLRTPKQWKVTHYPIVENKQVVAVYQETKDITDEVKSEERLDRAEHQLDQVLESNLIGTWFWDIKKSIISGDSNLAHMFDIDPTIARKGLPLKRFIDSVHPDDRSRVEASINEALHTGNSYEEEYRTIAADGSTRWVIARGYVRYDRTNKPLSFSGVIIDITDRKLTETALEDSESSLRFMTNTMPQLVWITGPDGSLQFANQQWYTFTGTDPDSTERKEVLHPDEQISVRKSWCDSLKTGKPYEEEYRLRHAPSGNYRWVIGRALPYKDKSGSIVRWYGTCTDIDEHKRMSQIQAFLGDASKELSSSLDYQKTLKKVTELCIPEIADWCTVDLYDEEKGFEQVSIAHIDPKKISFARKYRELNPVSIDQPTGLPKVIKTGKSEYYPYIADELLEQSIDNPKTLKYMKSLNLHSIIIAPLRISDKVVGGISFVSSDSGRYYTETDLHMAEELAARISLAITNSKLYADSQTELKNRHKLEKQLVIEKQKLESHVKERTKQLQLTNRGLREEINKRQAIEQELRENTQNLRRSNAELEDFAYVASHDLQEPLRKIQAFSNLLVSEYSEKLGEGADYIERMRSAASRMSTLIEDLLAFSRVTTKTNVPVQVNLRDVVTDVLMDLETSLADCKGTVTLGSLPSVQADPTHMRQLFQNLIGNALKFHKPDQPPMVEIKADTSNTREVKIYVIDNGIGFDEKYLEKIFSVFQRLHSRDSYDGTGIGLAVCRKIVERYDGTITAESVKNKGATFIVTLPREKEKAK